MSELALIIGGYMIFIAVVGFFVTWRPRPPEYRIYKWPTKWFVYGVAFLLLGWLTS